MLTCPACGKRVNLARWSEAVKRKGSDEVHRVSVFVPHKEDGGFDLTSLADRYPKNEYSVYSFQPDLFEGSPHRGYGAHCIKCDTALKGEANEKEGSL